jgi:NADH:ubiquinone oxidoreductase subunit F (NADH-binding)/NADH:ubiquinone oxidoreductase subunit E
MSDPAIRRAAARGASRMAVEEAARRIRERGPLPPSEFADIANTSGTPAAAARGAVSAYADLQSAEPELRVCSGTSCVLAGAPDAAWRLAAACRTAHCLGHCDASPTVLLRDGRVVRARQGADAADILAASAVPAPEVWSRSRERIVTARLGRGGLTDLTTARAGGVYDVLLRVLALPPSEVLARVERSGERGRGGAAFPTGLKWRSAAETQAEIRYVVANGDEGDPGSFVDRLLMEEDPHGILEGMAICAHAVGAREGIVFVRSEYPRAAAAMRRALEEAVGAGLLGRGGASGTPGFDVKVVVGMGGYVCGEETALISAIEGGRPEVRPRPPYPTEHGLYGCPTVVNNVETLVAVPFIVERPDDFRRLGTTSSPGTKAISLGHGFARPGLVEVEFGISLREVVEGAAGGGAGGTSLTAILLGGPMGSVVSAAELDVPVCYGAMADQGIVLGHAGMLALADGTDLAALVDHWLEFMAEESCGACMPCRLGSHRALELWRSGRLDELRDLLDAVAATSLCGFGQGIPGPVRALMDLVEGSA